jgi:hypothetical protein
MFCIWMTLLNMELPWSSWLKVFVRSFIILQFFNSKRIVFLRSSPLLNLFYSDETSASKPVPIQEQVATDEKGRRRFHGAFTGGFSAGYFNTVGSIEGTSPQRHL